MGTISIKMNDKFEYAGIEIFLDNPNRNSEVKTVRFNKADLELFTENVICDFAKAVTYIDKQEEEIYYNDRTVSNFMNHHPEYKWYPYRFNRGEFSFIVPSTVKTDIDFKMAMARNQCYRLPDGFVHAYILKIDENLQIASYIKDIPIYNDDIVLYPSSDEEFEFTSRCNFLFSKDSDITQVSDKFWMIKAPSGGKEFNWNSLKQKLICHIEEKNDEIIHQKMKELSKAQQLSINLRNYRSYCLR